VAVTVLLIWLLHGIWQTVRATPDQIRTVDFDQSRGLAFQFMREDSRRYLDAAILVLAGLWSVAVVNEGERVRHKDLPEIVMLGVASALFISFFYFAQQYGNVLERAYWDTASAKLFPDVYNSPYLTMYGDAATETFFASLFVSAITIFSLCLVRSRP
jgi:hypothetical protein